MQKLEMNQMESFIGGGGGCEEGFEICSVAEMQSEADYVAAHPMQNASGVAPNEDLCAFFGSLMFFGVSFLSFDQFKGYC
jgi:hypothetical protein